MAPADPIQIGEFYEDCRYFPMLCVQSAAPGDDELVGISLMDGSSGLCSEMHCGVVRLTPEAAIKRCVNWTSSPWPTICRSAPNPRTPSRAGPPELTRRPR